jgi:Ni,Fe-hydrogenase III small subunit/ferredoxin
MPWLFRGLREGVVTTRYPRRPDDYGASFRASVSLVDASPCAPEGARADSPGAGPADLCPTGAISVGEGRVQLDRGRCILCGRCVAQAPEHFRFDSWPEVASVGRAPLVIPRGSEDDDELARLREDLARRVRAFRRSVHVRHVDAGSDGSEEWEVSALLNPIYDVQRLGIYFTATPRHADVLLVTGAGSLGMRGPLATTYEAMAEPKVVVAAGTDATSGGLVHPSYATSGGIGGMVPVDVYVPGSPPSPLSLLHGILLAVGHLSEKAAVR